MSKLVRFQADTDRTLGKLVLADGWECYTLELPWRRNERRKSCIPDGSYRLARRESPLITRITRDEFREGYEVVPVADRSHIMLHHGNWARNSDGCILVGREPTAIQGELGVPNSLATFRELMKRLKRLEADNRLDLEIAWDLDEWPRYE